MKPSFKPAPGIIIAEYIEPFDKSSLTITSKSESRLLKGKIVAIGGDLTTPMGNIIQAEKYGKVGNVLYFLSYEGNYDWRIIEGKKYYSIKFEDCRFIL